MTEQIKHNNFCTPISKGGDNPLGSIYMNMRKMKFSVHSLRIKWLGVSVLSTINTTKAVNWKDFETDELKIEAYGGHDDDDDYDKNAPTYYSIVFNLYGDRRETLTSLILRLENDDSIKEFSIVLHENLTKNTADQ